MKETATLLARSLGTADISHNTIKQSYPALEMWSEVKTTIINPYRHVHRKKYRHYYTYFDNGRFTFFQLHSIFILYCHKKGIFSNNIYFAISWFSLFLGHFTGKLTKTDAFGILTRRLPALALVLLRDGNVRFKYK